jgi:hypothetical protein
MYSSQEQMLKCVPQQKLLAMKATFRSPQLMSDNGQLH